jgi:hypothetical protein
MAMPRFVSVSAPLDDPRVLPTAARLVRRAAGLGLVPTDEPHPRLDLELIQDIARRASAEGVGQDTALAIIGHRRGGAVARLEALLAQLDEALAESPVPERELGVLLPIYGLEALARLLGVAPVSLRRYAAGSRRVPDALALRIHFVALVTADLAGSYNELGMRRWWERPRTPLGGRSPRDALGPVWDPDDPAAEAVAALARSLAGPGGAT